MSLFGKLVRTAINVGELPLAVAKDVLTLGGICSEQNPRGDGQTYTREQIEKLKDEAD
jgi:hypothetical protein